MKKVIVTLFVIGALTASLAYAAGISAVKTPAGTPAWILGDSNGNATIEATTNTPQAQFKLSANVYTYWVSGLGVSYAITTGHSTGTKSYASAATDNRLYMVENAAKNSWLSTGTGTEPTKIAALDATGNADFAAWSAVK